MKHALGGLPERVTAAVPLARGHGGMRLLAPVLLASEGG